MRTLRVATFNIHHGEGLDRRIDLRRTAAAITATGARLVALQELDRGMERSERADQPSELGELLGLEVSFWPTLRRDGDYGIAVAAEGELSARFEPLPRIEDEEPRGAVVARWNGITVVGTHLSLKEGPRRVQTEALSEMVTGLEGPVVVMGDLNQTGATLGPLIEAGLHASPDSHSSFARRLRRRQFDHVLAGGGARVVRSWTVRSRASDHLPVAAEVESP